MNLLTYLNSNNILTDEQADTFNFLKVEGMTLVQNIMKLKYPTRLLMIDEAETNFVVYIQTWANTVLNMHLYNWTKKYNTINIVYDMLTEQDMTETDTDTNSGSDTETNTASHTGTVQNTRTDNLNDITSRNSYDNLTMTETELLNHGGTQNNTDTNDLTDTYNNTKNYGHVFNKTRTVKGRDSRTPQELIKQERDVAEYNFYEMIADEVTDFICNYDYEYNLEV